MNGWRVAALVLGILAVLCLAWIAEETHYQACIERAVAQYPGEETKTVDAAPFVGGGLDGGSGVGATKVKELDERRAALAECSWP